jgi:FtsZ-interacting cell division protein ZipA
MDAGQITWLIIAIVVFVLLIVLVLTLVRRRSEGRKEHLRARAAELRSEAKQDELEVREREARSLEAKAKAERAEVEAAKLRRQAEEASGVAQEGRHKIDEQLRKADELDPDKHGSSRADRAEDDGHDDPRRGEPVRDDLANGEANGDVNRDVNRDGVAARERGRHSHEVGTQDPDVEAALDSRRREREPVDQPPSRHQGNPSEGRP